MARRSTRTKSQQVKLVCQGLTLGDLANGVEAVSGSKIDLELALMHAWHRWRRARDFTSIGNAPKPDNELWIGLVNAERRQGVWAAWRMDRCAEPFIVQPDWTVEECTDLLASEGVTHDEWVELGRLFIEGFREEQVRLASV